MLALTTADAECLARGGVLVAGCFGIIGCHAKMSQQATNFFNYMTAQYYTGNNGLSSWAGFAVDILNPVDISATLADIGIALTPHIESTYLALIKPLIDFLDKLYQGNYSNGRMFNRGIDDMPEIQALKNNKHSFWRWW